MSIDLEKSTEELNSEYQELNTKFSNLVRDLNNEDSWSMRSMVLFAINQFAQEMELISDELTSREKL